MLQVLLVSTLDSSNQKTQATGSWAFIVDQILINLLKLSSIFFLKSPHWNGSICTVQTKYTWFKYMVYVSLHLLLYLYNMLLLGTDEKS